MKTRVLLIVFGLATALPAMADVAGVIGESDIVLERANRKPEEAMPLGNGRLGAAIWSEEGLTIQLNRADTLPGRLSPGQIVVPGLGTLTQASDYKGRVDLYNGEFRESGGGGTALLWVEHDLDVVVIDVHGAPPDHRQTVMLRLWTPRQPTFRTHGSIALASETWKDDKAPGASGETFGSLAAITVDGRDVQPAERGPLQAGLSFLPGPDGSFRIFVAAPSWKGGDGLAGAQTCFARARAISDEAHRRWWNRFWERAGLMKLASADHAAEYFENLRAIDLFLAAAESGYTFPGSQAGVGDLFSSARDFHKWDPSAYWHWNLRMQVAANLGAGLFDLNAPYFRLYRQNLANIERWTRAHMDGRPGVCVPETMRFNGQGIEFESWTKGPSHDCDANWTPYYNARTLSTGAEVALWIWRQYQMTGDRAFLAENYPAMADAARFLLAYAKRGEDGKLHTFPSNAHENQWDVHDPITDLCAMRALFSALSEAARLLGRDADLASEAQKALAAIMPFPLEGSPGDEVFGESYDPQAPVHNTENLGLEPVWPYQLIGASDPRAIRTYQRRPNQFQNDWSYDPIDAAHLGQADGMKTALRKINEKYQAYPSGLAQFVGPEFYREQIGVVAAALQDALAHDFHGVLQVAPAWPSDWDADATVFVCQASRVFVRMRDGRAAAAIFQAGFTGTLRYRIGAGAVSELAVKRGGSYDLLTRRSAARIPEIEGHPADHPRQLGTRSIGLPPA